LSLKWSAFEPESSKTFRDPPQTGIRPSIANLAITLVLRKREIKTNLAISFHGKLATI
jgi:hypothetical protein